MPKDAIFSPAFGNRPSHLVGRQNVISSFLEGLEQSPGSRERATVLLGQRGSGKTVLLWELGDRARERGFVVANPTVVTEGMLDRIIEKIQEDGERYVKGPSAHLSGGSIGVSGFSAGLQFSPVVQESKSFQYKLAHLCRKLAEHDKGVLILVDEIQANSPEVRQLVAAYQELIGERCNIALVMAGLPAAIAATLNDRVLTFLNRANKMVLEPLPSNEIDAFFARAFQELGLIVPSDIRTKAVEGTYGSPHLLQLVGHNLTVYAHEDGTVDEEALDNALNAAQADFENDVCRTTLAALSDQDVTFLRAMAEDDGSCRMADIAERMGVTPDYAQKYRKRLLEAGIIEAPRRGHVAFAVPFLADYLAEEKDLA